MYFVTGFKSYVLQQPPTAGLANTKAELIPTGLVAFSTANMIKYVLIKVGGGGFKKPENVLT